MNVTVKTPNITQYEFIFDSDDSIYFNCTWARINLDHDTYTMTATTDCGDYAYTWHVTPKEPFVDLMARIGEQYLLGKIAEENVFCFDESKEQAVELAKEIGIYAYCDLSDIEDMDYCDYPTEESFYRRIEEMTDWDYETIPIVKKYPIGAVIFAKLFCEYLQPILRSNDEV